MRFVENGHGSGCAKGPKPNERTKDEKKEVMAGVAGEGQGLPKEDGRRILVDSKDANCRLAANSVHPPVDTRRSQPQSQGQLVCWERFLPVRSIKVLLVESDDSTRHVVSALLRNCSYEVIAVSNGIEAWKILADLNNQIDLVLTEVVMSGLSGVGLLSKIMSHKSCRNVPVIMMSSYDSMGIVLKCLSKGAADFLVKPIRKNELKNLWQHVWRRCNSSCGSGSESGVRNEKSTGAKNAQDSENDTASNEEDDCRSFGLEARDGSDNGSGTQSSWTKRAAEVDSPQPPSLLDHLVDPPDSTCAQAIFPGSEAFASSWVPVSAQEHSGHDKQLENVSMGNNLEIEMPRDKDSQPKVPSKMLLTCKTDRNQSSKLDLNKKSDGQLLDEKLEINNDKPKHEETGRAVSLPEHFVSRNEDQTASAGCEKPSFPCEKSECTNKAMTDRKEFPSLELSLKRLGYVAEASINVSEQNILRHSELSAFTRYNTGSTAKKGLTGNVGSCSPVGNSSEAAKPPKSDSTPNQNSNSSSNNNDMGSTTHRSCTKPPPPTAADDKAPAKPNLYCSHQTSPFQPKKNSPISEPQLMSSGKAITRPVNFMLQENDMLQKAETQQHNHKHLFDSVQKPQLLAAHDVMSMENMNGTSPQCGSSSTRRGLTEANLVNCSLNESACGSNHGSNLHNGSSAAVNVEGMDIVDDNDVAVNEDTDNGSGNGGGGGVDQNRSSQREAALYKFRLKRKERCFDKKVRYQSRKKLAEQRPRVRGQFVKKVLENEGNNADS